MLRALVVVAALPLTSACDSQTDSDYRGDVLAELRGVVTLPAALAAPAEMEIIIAWDYDAGDGDKVLGQTAPVRGEFPARFTLSITEPPPEEVLGGTDTDQIDGATAGDRVGAYGYIVVKPTGASVTAVEEGTALPVGISPDYVVLWTSYDFPADSYEAVKFGGALTAGYHLLAVTPAEEYLAAHPEIAACDDREYDTECPYPEGDGDAEWAAWEACYDQARKDVGCFMPPSWQDRLAPAPAGFESEIAITLSYDPDALENDVPNLH